MKRLLSSLLIISSIASYGQTFKYYYSNSPKFLKGSDTLAFPFTGGVNAPQFSTIDFNMDGHKDIFVFDRSTSRVLCFVSTPSGYRHAPQYEFKFPFMAGWALLRDFNLDGKEDLWTTPINDRRYAFDSLTWPDFHSMRILVQMDSVFGFKGIGQQVLDTGKSKYGFKGPPLFDVKPQVVIGNYEDIPSLEDMDGDGDIDILLFNTLDLSPGYYENYKVNPQHISYGKDSTRFIFRDKCWGGIFYNAEKGRFNIHRAYDDLDACTYRHYTKQKRDAGTTNLMLDIDQDGIKDLIYGDKSFPYLLALINGKDMHPLLQDSIISQDTIFPKNTTAFNHILFPAAYYVDADGDDLNDLLVTTNLKEGAKNTQNVWMYKNTGTPTSPVFNYQGNVFFMFDQTIDLGARTVPIVIDMNGDHKNDLLIATSGDFEKTKNTKDRLVYYQNKGTNSKPVFELVDDDFLGLSAEALVEMHPTFGDLTGDGKPDMVIGLGNGKLMYYKNTGSIATPFLVLITAQLGDIDVGNNAAPQLVDLNKDGLMDLIIGNMAGVISYYKNEGSSTAPIFNSTATIDTLGGVVTRDFYLTAMGYETSDLVGYATPQVCELDGDTTTMEMVTGTWSGRVLIYTNVSDSVGKIFTKQDSLFALTAETDLYSLRFGQRSAPYAANLDDDDRLDLLIGNMGGGLNFYASIPSKVDTTLIGVAKAQIERIKVYPNPATNELRFDTHPIRETMQYKIIDVAGKVLLTGSVNHFYGSFSVNIQDVSEGMYFLKLEGNTQRFVTRFLVQR
jgi:hypothetical protein